MSPLRERPFCDSGDILFIVPPFGGIDRPSLGVHILQEISRSAGLTSEVFYANLDLARAIGEAAYVAITYSPPLDLIGERLFAPFAFPGRQFSDAVYRGERTVVRASQQIQKLPDIRNQLQDIEHAIGEWLQAVESELDGISYRVFAFSSMFAQNLGSIALANMIRRKNPCAIMIMGGANCDGPMSEEIGRIAPCMDYIFSGESEVTFREFCDNLSGARLTDTRIICGVPTADLESIPCPDYTTYFQQLEYYLPNSELKRSEQIILPYETSRGCWWGQKHHCTFCGLNANGMSFRVKSADKALIDLSNLVRRHGKYRVAMTDNIMPVQYFSSFLPKIVESGLGLDIFYEEKSNLKYAQVCALRDAGITQIQPGIEALSSSLLKRMKKGVSAVQNVRLLKWCRGEQVKAVWNLLYGIPGEVSDEFAETLALIPSLTHLFPPNGFSRVSFDRFSPYFDKSEEFSISNIRPHPNYEHVYPVGVNLHRIAYHFVGDAQDVETQAPELVQEIRSAVRAWIECWRGESAPVLAVVRTETNELLLVDTRDAELPHVEVIDIDMARAVCLEGREMTPSVSVGLERRWIVKVDGTFMGLGTADRGLLQELI